MGILQGLGAALSLALLVYLAFAMLAPEKFG